MIIGFVSSIMCTTSSSSAPAIIKKTAFLGVRNYFNHFEKETFEESNARFEKESEEVYDLFKV